MDIKELKKRRANSAVTNWKEIQEKRQQEITVLQQEMDKDDSSRGSPDDNSKNKSKKIVLPPTPPGYNKKKRDIVKLILVVVAAASLNGDPVVATVLSIVSILCLKEGTFWSTRNLKWMWLCIMSCATSSAAWSLERDSYENNEEQRFGKNSMFWTSAKVIQICWGMTLSVFLFSAYLHGHNSFLEFDFLYEAQLPPPKPRTDPPPKTYLVY